MPVALLDLPRDKTKQLLECQRQQQHTCRHHPVSVPLVTAQRADIQNWMFWHTLFENRNKQVTHWIDFTHFWEVLHSPEICIINTKPHQWGLSNIIIFFFFPFKNVRRIIYKLLPAKREL